MHQRVYICLFYPSNATGKLEVPVPHGFIQSQMKACSATVPIGFVEESAVHYTEFLDSLSGPLIHLACFAAKPSEKQQKNAYYKNKVAEWRV